MGPRSRVAFISEHSTSPDVNVDIRLAFLDYMGVMRL